MPDRIQATTFDEKQCRSLIDQLGAGRVKSGRPGRFSDLWDLIKTRDDHFYNRTAANPRFLPPYDQVTTYQSDVLRQTHDALISRLVENPFRVQVTPPNPKSAAAKAANDWEVVLETGLEVMEERTGERFQAALGDGQLLHCYGVLHWQKAADLLPDFPDPEFLDSPPEGELTKRFHREADEDDADDERKRPKRRKGKFRERDEALAERHRERKAQAGFPWHMEVPRSDQVAFVRDRSAAPGFALVIYVRDVPRLDYVKKLAEKDQLTVAFNDLEGRVRIYEEQAGPLPDEHSAGPEAWGQLISVAHIWTRDEAYELVRIVGSQEHSEWTLVKSWQHPYEQPPFALATAKVLNADAPHDRYLPAMAGVFKVKPAWDYERSLQRILSEQIVLPKFWIKLSENSYMMDPDTGDKVVVTENSELAKAMPPGASLEKVEFQMNPAFVQSLEITKQELEESTPATGFIEDIGASTQPHTLNLAQAQANVPVKLLKQAQTRCLQEALRNITMVSSKSAEDGGFGEEIVVLAKADGEKFEEDTVVGVDPADLATLDIDVRVDVNSAAQQIAIQEHGRARLADPNDPLSRKQYLEEFVGEQNPEKVMEEHIVDLILREAEPLVIEQELAKALGDVFVVTPSGRFAGPGGQEVGPEQVLAANGIRVAPPNGVTAPQASPAPGNTPNQFTPAAAAPNLQPLGPLRPANQGAVQ